MKGNADCHLPNDNYRDGWDRVFGEKRRHSCCDPECDHLKPYGKKYDLLARCSLLNIDLGWYDYWTRECE